MNDIYRPIWNEPPGAWAAVSGTARGRGSERVATSVAPVVLALTLAGSAAALAADPPAPTQLPTGGKVVAGTAAISQAGAAMNVTQSTARAAIDWQTFNVGAAARVNFLQPSDRPPSGGPGGMLVESWPLRQRVRRSRSA